MLKPLLLFSAVMLTLLAAAPAVGRVPQGQDAGKAGVKVALAPVDNKVKKFYELDCAMCHGDNGNGKTDLATSMDLKMTDWTDSKSLSEKTDQELFDIIRKGKDKMPPEDTGRAKDDEVKGLVQYVRTLSGAPAAK